MLGKTHIVIGISSTLALTQPKSISEFILAVSCGACGALISDIDVETSNQHHKADKITTLAFFIISGVIALDYFFNMGIIEEVLKNSSYVRILAGIFMFIGICAFGKDKPHRSFMHSFLALILLDFAVGLIWKNMVIYFSIGFLSHLAADILNKRKLRLFYPFKGGICLGLFHAYGIANSMLFIIGSIAIVAEIVLFTMRVVM